ncbi:MAG TPA: ABC transporter ATP-binding protein [Candidatus Limnocylindria bacterium]|nr:ABC transporter ATP-binding protein [Candidatus Limnocylindria bacterium]
MRLTFSAVSKTFLSLRGPVRAVRGVDLAVGEGEFFVLLGPSGCGKSTVLNLAAGLVKPNSGEIRLGGRVVASRDGKVFVSPKERNVAMVFQSYALYPHLTVFENIAFPLRVAGVTKDEIDKAVNQAAGMLGIGDIREARPAELSGGQRQRVAIARAIVRKPALFLLDEPLSNLDAGLRASTRSELKRLQRELGVTAVYVTHDQTEAMTLGDRIALLRDGRIVQTGTPEDLYERPETPFAASFIGQVPMNLVDASVREEGGDLYLRLGEARLLLPPGPAARVRSIGSAEILFGIRPEHIGIARGTAGSPVTGTVTSLENLGREVLLQVRVDGLPLSVLTNDKSIREGDTVALDIPLEAAHFFRKESEP